MIKEEKQQPYLRTRHDIMAGGEGKAAGGKPRGRGEVWLEEERQQQQQRSGRALARRKIVLAAPQEPRHQWAVVVRVGQAAVEEWGREERKR